MSSLIRDIGGITKFSFLPVAYLISTVVLLIGSDLFLGVALGIFLLLLSGELISTKDNEEFDYGHDGLFKLHLCLSAFILISYLLVFLWFVMAPQVDFLGLAQLMNTQLDLDIMEPRQDMSSLMVSSVWLFTFFAPPFLAIVIAHELIHKPSGTLSYRIGVTAQIVTFMSYFSIAHPRGHHNLVCLDDDPATPRRGENFYTFMLRSLIGQRVQAWELEKHRLANKQLPAMHWSNQALQRYLLEILFASSVIAYGGLPAAAAILFIALSSNITMEMTNYAHHYGLVRQKGKPVGARHTWDNTYKITTFMAMGGTRHSYHHLKADTPYWHYKDVKGAAAETIAGLFTSIFLSLIPPLHRRLITPKLIDWDWKLATPVEQQLAVAASRSSGQTELIAHADELESYLQSNDRMVG